MAMQKMVHVGIVVTNLEEAVGFFSAIGLTVQGEAAVEGAWVDRIVGLEGVRSDVVLMQAPDGSGRLELIRFHAPVHRGDASSEPANAPGLRHIAFAVDDVEAVIAALGARGADLVGSLERYGDGYRLCYVRGPDGIIVELVEQTG